MYIPLGRISTGRTARETHGGSAATAVQSPAVCSCTRFLAEAAWLCKDCSPRCIRRYAHGDSVRLSLSLSLSFASVLQNQFARIRDASSLSPLLFPLSSLVVLRLRVPALRLYIRCPEINKSKGGGGGLFSHSLFRN